MNPVLSKIQDLDSVECRRLFHGRGKCYIGFEGICVDWYPPFLLITLYEESNESAAHEVIDACKERSEIKGIILQKRYLPKSPKEVVWGDVPERVIATENGIKFWINLLSNQNHGFFLDTRLGRELVKEHSSGKKVLNLFSYTCAFSLYAYHGGASSIVNIDMSKGAINIGSENHQLNDVPKGMVRFLAHDIFKSFGKIKKLGPYDLIIIDPPSYQGKSFSYKTDYKKIVKRLGEFLAPGGEVIACLNDPMEGHQFLLDLFSENSDLKSADIIFSPPEFEEQNDDAGVKIIRYRDVQDAQ